MILAIFGGSGATGHQVIKQAIDKGYNVRALIRPGSEINIQSDNLELFEGSLEDTGKVVETVEGSHAVCCVLGPRSPYKDVFCASATEVIINAMKKCGIERLICLTGAMIGDYKKNRSILFQLLTTIVNKRVPSLMQDRVEQEKHVVNSELNWTIIKPPRLTNTDSPGNYKVGEDLKVGLFSFLPRQKLASFIVNEIEEQKYVQKTVFIRK